MRTPRRPRGRRLGYALVAACLLLGGQAARGNTVTGTETATGADAVLDWNAVMQATVSQVPDPFLQVRSATITQLAVFEAVNAIVGDYQPYLGSVTAPPGASPEAAAVAAAHRALASLHPDQAAAFGAAARRVLERTLGPGGHAITLASPLVPDVVLHYTSWKQITDDGDDARIYGGVHRHRPGRQRPLDERLLGTNLCWTRTPTASTTPPTCWRAAPAWHSTSTRKPAATSASTSAGPASTTSPDNIALELFAPPGEGTRRLESAMHLARAVAAIMARSTWPPTGCTSPARRSVDTDMGSLLAKLGLRDRAEAAEPSRLSSRWTADHRTRGGP